MQIDFHHSAVYALARLAGIDKAHVDIIAHSNQYIDDSLNSGVIYFKNRAVYETVSAAHKIFDYRNFRELANNHVWVPFHFLPGNQTDPKLDNIAGPFVQRTICRKDSEVARHLVEKLFEYRDRDCFYQLFGCITHVYLDTFSHYGFSGIDHDVNFVEKILDYDGGFDKEKNLRIKKYFKRNIFQTVWDWLKSHFVGKVGPVGHGPALSYPDRPYLKWCYVDKQGSHIKRDNPADYLEACDRLFQIFYNFKNNNAPFSKAAHIPDKDRQLIQKLINESTDDKGHLRHEKWLNAIKSGLFSFGPEDCSYQKRLDGIELDKDQLEAYEHKHIYRNISYPPSFIGSNWKNTHDAIILTRQIVLQEVLPKFGICLS